MQRKNESPRHLEGEIVLQGGLTKKVLQEGVFCMLVLRWIWHVLYNIEQRVCCCVRLWLDGYQVVCGIFCTILCMGVCCVRLRLDGSDMLLCCTTFTSLRTRKKMDRTCVQVRVSPTCLSNFCLLYTMYISSCLLSYTCTQARARPSLRVA